MPLPDNLIPARLYEFLTPTQEMVLYMVTFMGRYKDNPLIDEKVMANFSIGKAELVESFGVLSERKLLSYGRDNIRGICRSFTGLFLRHALHIIERNPHIMVLLERVLWTEQSPNAAFLWKVAKDVSRGGITAPIRQPLDVTLRPEDWYAALRGYVMDGRLTSIYTHLPRRTFHDVTTLFIFDSFLGGNCSGDLYSHLSALVDGSVSISPEDASALRDHLALYRWLCLGEDFPSWRNSLDNVWRRMACLIRDMYRGEEVDFMGLFPEGKDGRNNDKVDHTPLYDPLCAYFISLGQEMKTSPLARERLPLVLSRADERRLRGPVLLQRLWDILSAHELGDGQRKALILSLGREMGQGDGIRLYCMLLSRYYGYSDIYSQFRPQPSKRGQVPIFVELEHSSLVPGSDIPPACKVIGERGILSQLPNMEVWERTLGDIRALLDESLPKGTGTPEDVAHAQAESPPMRYIYVIGDNGSFEIRSQTRSTGEDGGFKGPGTHVEPVDFCADKSLEGMDLEVSYRLKSLSRPACEATTVLPLLVRCERVFSMRDRQLIPLQVRSDVPYLEVKLRDGAYMALSNIGASSTWRIEGDNVFLRDGNRITVVGTTSLQRDLVGKFLSRGIYPKEADDLLRETLLRVSRLIEVRSDLLDEDSSAGLVKGDPRLTLQITPGKDSTFIMEAMVRPLEDVDEAFNPGEGPNPVFMGPRERRTRVRRDLQRETANLSLLGEFLSERKIAKSAPGEDFRPDSPGSALYVLDAPTTLDLLEWVPSHGEDICVRWPRGGKIDLLQSPRSEDVKLRISSRENWFEVEGDVNLGDGTTIPLSMLLNLLGEDRNRSSKYVALSRGQYLLLSSALRRQLQALEGISESGPGCGKVPALRIGALSRIIRSGEVSFEGDPAFSELERRMEESLRMDIPIPRGLNATLRDYQVEGFRWMARLDSWGAGACLGDDMGLGKTVQTITFLLYRKDRGPSLVVAPSSVVMNWKNELGRFAPQLGVRILNVAADRGEAVRDAGPGDIVVTTYGLLASEIELLGSREWNVCVLDEAHIIRNRHTKTSEAAMRLSSASRVILTGTPVQNYLGELWNLFQFLNPGLLGTYEKFHSRFIVPIQQRQDPDRSEQLRRLVQPFMLRRTKAEVIDELPEKTDIVRYVSLSGEEMLLYEDLRERARTAIAGAKKVNMTLLSDITRLRECACDPSLVRDGWIGATSKVDALRDLVDEILEGGNKVLVFSQFTRFLSICRTSLERDGIPYLYLDGSTPMGKRAKMVKDFQEGGEDCPGVFLISLMAGGLGLNLTAANYVILLDPWWNPATQQQATDRAYRIGQRRSVTIYQLISQGTIEEKILRLHKTKRDIADSILGGTGTSHSLTLEDLRGLVED